MAQLKVPDQDYFHPGHLGCPGCGAAIAIKFALKALDAGVDGLIATTNAAHRVGDVWSKNKAFHRCH